MTQTYTLEGLHCGACIKRVEKALLALPEITTASVTLDTATIELSAPIERETLQNAIAKAGIYNIREQEAVEAA